MTDDETVEAMADRIRWQMIETGTDADALARAALAVVREWEGWRPIETAPKDGSKWHPERGPVVLLGSVFGQRALAYWDGECWASLHDHRRLDYWNAMTHWQSVAEAPTDQPLPAPPEGE